MKKNRAVYFIILLSCIVLLVSCTHIEREQVSTVNQEQSHSVGSENEYYPVTVSTYDYQGNEITTVYEKQPERVLAVYQSSIETMIALGLEDKVVASYGLDNQVKAEWQVALNNMNYHDDVFAPDKETVIAINPDMIFSWGSYFSEKQLGDAKNWIELGIRPYINTNTSNNNTPRTLENEYRDLLNIGIIFNKQEEAEQLIQEMEHKIGEIISQTSEKEAESVAILEFIDHKIINYGETSLGGDMVMQLGGFLAMPKAKTIGEEDLLASDPDVIFVVYMPVRVDIENTDMADNIVQELLNNPIYSTLNAVQNGRVYPIMLGDMYASAVRSIDGIQVFSRGLYPELDSQS